MRNYYLTLATYGAAPIVKYNTILCSMAILTLWDVRDYRTASHLLWFTGLYGFEYFNYDALNYICSVFVHTFPFYFPEIKPLLYICCISIKVYSRPRIWDLCTFIPTVIIGIMMLYYFSNKIIANTQLDSVIYPTLVASTLTKPQSRDPIWFKIPWYLIVPILFLNVWSQLNNADSPNFMPANLQHPLYPKV
jgi:hypothetical protein